MTGTVTFTPHVKPLSLVALPYLAETYEQGWKLYDTSAFIKAQTEALVGKGMRVIGDWEAGFRSFTTNFPISSPADVQGQEAAHRAGRDDALDHGGAWAASPIVMPVTEVYLAIQQNTVSGQENPIDTIYSQRFYEVAKHITLSQHVYSPLWLAIAERTCKTLTPHDQEAVMRRPPRRRATGTGSEVRANDDRLLAEMTAKGATVVRPDLAVWRKAAEAVYERARKEYGAEAVDQILKEAEAIRKSPDPAAPYGARLPVPPGAPGTRADAGARRRDRLRGLRARLCAAGRYVRERGGARGAQRQHRLEHRVRRVRARLGDVPGRRGRRSPRCAHAHH